MVSRSMFPFNDFVYLQHQLDQLAQDAFGMRAQASVATLPVDVFDTGDQIVVQAYLPGVRAEHLDVQVEDGVVTISGNFPQLYDTDDARSYTWHTRELRTGRFQRSTTLPYKVDWDGSNASISDGILRMTFPKAAEAKPRRISIANTPSEAGTPELTATSTSQ
ncbi:MAG TPA: Hsp20/alpha crystallin family protein [Thermomicrobiales bacterium]|nr:Hsp20/alpha crystallin family protein [Thermomicrobiales bacterium]